MVETQAAQRPRRGVQLTAISRDTTLPSERRGVQLNALQTSHQGHRRSIRLEQYDYSQSGAYFVTICTTNRLPYFDNTAIHTTASDCWLEIPSHFHSVHLDEWILMPNHLHGILVFEDAEGVHLNAPTTATRSSRNRFSSMSSHRNTLAVVVRTYKAAVTSMSRHLLHTEFAWQRNYHEHIIRNEDELNRIRQYILDNPLKWDSDELNPQSSHDARPVGAFK